MDNGPKASSTPRRVLRIALAAAKWLVVVSGVALLLVVLVNLRDEDLTPEAKALAEFEPPTVPDGQNAFVALTGFDAPMGGDPIAAGARAVKELAVETRLADLASDKVPPFLVGAGPEVRNPYDGKPFAWDAATRSLTFEPKSERVLKKWKFKAAVPPPLSAAAR